MIRQTDGAARGGGIINADNELSPWMLSTSAHSVCLLPNFIARPDFALGIKLSLTILIGGEGFPRGFRSPKKGFPRGFRGFPRVSANHRSRGVARIICKFTHVLSC